MSALTTELNQAVQLHQAGDLRTAERLYENILRRDPAHSDALHLLGVAAHQSGRSSDAVFFIRRAVAINDQVALYHCNLGSAYRALGQHEKALASFQEAIRLDASLAGAHYNRALTLEKLGRPDEAAAAFRAAVDMKPDFAEAHFNLGNMLAALGRHSEAVASYKEARRLAPNIAEIPNNLGTSLLALGDDAAARECFEEAVRLRPDYAEAHNNLGSALHHLGDLTGAEKSFRRAIGLRTDFPGAHTNLGNVANDRGDLNLAIEHYGRAIALDPQSAEAHFNRALAWLRSGEFERGWREYEWRWKRKVAPRNFPQLVWNGEPLAGKRILAYAEQGIGDEIQFASCLPELLALGGETIIECDRRLVALFARSFPAAQVVARDLTCGGFEADFQISFGSLPSFFRRSIDEFPNRPCYLVADKQRVEDAGCRMAAGVMHVGISWQGGAEPEARRKRSIPLPQWHRLLSTHGIQFHSLMPGNHRAELAEVKQSIGVEITQRDELDRWNDLDGLAAELIALDLVITVDNSTAHLAGALGVPVWTILPFAADWRWLTGRDSSPWYPSMRLFRQTSAGEWDRVLERVEESLVSARERRT